MIIENTYFLPKDKYNDTNKLKLNGWNYSSKYSTLETKFYTMKFPCYFYNSNPQIFCTLILNTEDGNIEFDVRDSNNNIYSAFHTSKYHTPSLVLFEVENAILLKLNKLGVNKKDVKR